MDHISIIIVHYNADRDTRECLASLMSLKTNQNFKYNIILLDNASKEPFKLKKNYLNVELIRSDSNLGFTGGNNLAIKYALEKYDSDYVLLLNNDTLIEPDFLKNLYKCAKGSSKAGLITPKIYFAKNYEFHSKSYTPAQKGHIIWYVGGSIDWRNLLFFHPGIDEVDRGQFEKMSEVSFASGCCLLVPREIIETVGLLDEDLFLYSEDVDYSLRVKRSGYKLLYCPKSVIWHKNANSSGGSGNDLQVYYQTRNRLWMAKKHGDYRAKYLALRIILQILRSGTQIEKEAMQDFISGNMGKKPII